MLRGSYHNGFAPRDGMPLFPSLWQGCVGAWAPCLGPTGLTLRDWAPYKRHGTLTNLTAANAWNVSQRHAMAFANLSTEVVSVNSTGWSTTQGTMSCWINKTAATAANNDYVIWSKVTSGTDRLLLEIETFSNDVVTTNPQLTALFASSAVTGNVASNLATTSLNTWIHVAVTWQNGAPLRLWINGVNTISTANNYTTQSQTTVEYFGNYSSGSLSFGGLLDDMRRYDRVVNPNEIALLASRRGIAYDLAPMPMLYSAAGFQAAWALRQRLILGGGGGMG